MSSNKNNQLFTSSFNANHRQFILNLGHIQREKSVSFFTSLVRANSKAALARSERLPGAPTGPKSSTRARRAAASASATIGAREKVADFYLSRSGVLYHGKCFDLLRVYEKCVMPSGEETRCR